MCGLNRFSQITNIYVDAHHRMHGFGAIWSYYVNIRHKVPELDMTEPVKSKTELTKPVKSNTDLTKTVQSILAK